MSIEELTSLSMAEIDALGEEKIQSSYSYVRRLLKSRIRTFRKHDLGEAVPKWLMEGVPTVKELGSPEAVNRALKRAIVWIAGPTGTEKQYRQVEDRVRSSLSELMGGKPLTAKEFAKYKRFLDDMSARMKESWKHVSNEALELAIAARRLGVDVNNFRENFDYWSAHAHLLQNVRRSRKEENRSIDAYTQRLRKNLKKKGISLPTVDEWRKEHPLEE